MSVLDYGCGKGTLKQHLHDLDVREYDPAVMGKDDAPVPADLVYCGDVLEHVEPECIDHVLNDLKRVTGKIGIFNIATHPAAKFLPDGRNTHLIVHPAEWWMERLRMRFVIQEFHGARADFSAIILSQDYFERLKVEQAKKKQEAAA